MTYQPHDSTDLSANFTIAQNYADLSANFSLNQQYCDLSANCKIHNLLSYFQHSVESTTGANFLTPLPIDNYVIRQANRDKIATIDVKYSNTGDRFSWVTPASILQVFAGSNVNNKTKLFGGKVKEPEWQGENIIVHGQGYGEELLRRRITDAIYDIEATDLIKNHLLSGTSIDSSSISFIGEETTRTSFHSDSYSDESNIEETSNVSLSGGTWDLDETTDPSGGDWCENNSSDWDIDAGLTLSDEDTIIEVGSYSLDISHATELENDGFEAYTVGQDPAGNWTVEEPGTCNVEVVSSPVDEGSKALLLDSSGNAGDYVAAVNTLGSAETVATGYIEWRWLKVGATQTTYATVRDGSNSKISLQISSSEALQYLDGTWKDIKTGLSLSTYYKIKIIYDLDADTFDCWVDDVEEATGLAFDNTATQFTNVRFSNIDTDAGNVNIDKFIWVRGAGSVNREAYYISTKDLSRNLNQKLQLDFYIRQDDADDEPVLRLYSSAGNFYYRTVSITSADTFELKEYDVGTGSAGWSSTGSPDWTDIDWIAFYWSSAQTTVSHTYLDGLHFDQYHASGYIISDDLTTISEASTSTQEYFDDVKIDITGTTPTGTSITIKACNDDGTTYETFTDATWGIFTDHHSSASSHGRIFKYKIEFATTDASETPTLSQITIDVKTKLITVYDRIEYDNETLFDGIKDVLYDASLEGYTDTTASYQLALVKDKTTTDFIPYLRQGYEILKEPTWKKGSKTLINSLKGRGAIEGSYTKAEQDTWTENDSSDWTGTNCTVSDETSSTYVKEQDYCIKLALTGTGWTDDCSDATIDADYFDTSTSSGGTVTEASGYIKCNHPDHASAHDDVAFIYFDETNHPLSGDYDISVDVYFPQSAYYPVFFFVTNPPQSDTYWTLRASFDCLEVIGTKEWVLRKGGSDQWIFTGKNIPGWATWFTLRIVRSGTTSTFYCDGEEIWSGTLTDSDHDNIQFGKSDTDQWQPAERFDNWNYNYSAAASNALSPTFNKNLDVYENLYCWYRQDSGSSFDIRLETDASNYFSKTLTPQKVNNAYELKNLVGSKSAGWSETGSPDWTDITQIRFVYGAGASTSTVYIDKLYFTVTPIETTYDDTDSQDTHGVYEGKTYINKQITAIDELEDRLIAIVNSYKDLNEPLDLVVYGRRDINTGDLVKVHFPKAGITNTIFRVDEVPNK